MILMPCSNAARMVETDSASSVPPHIHPPMAQVPIATGDTLSDVPGMSASSMFILKASAGRAMILLLLRVLVARWSSVARCRGGGRLLPPLPEDPGLQPVEVDIDDRRRIERQNLRQS